jgi:hypothetical protein
VRRRARSRHDEGDLCGDCHGRGGRFSIPWLGLGRPASGSNRSGTSGSEDCVERRRAMGSVMPPVKSDASRNERRSRAAFRPIFLSILAPIAIAVGRPFCDYALEPCCHVGSSRPRTGIRGAGASRFCRIGPLSSRLPVCGETVRMRGRPHPVTLPSPRKRGEGHAFPCIPRP